MAVNVQFAGVNRRFFAAPRADGTIKEGLDPYYGFETANSMVTYTAWRPDPQEMEEIIRTGIIMVATIGASGSGRMMFVGSRKYVVGHAIDFGGVWKNKVLAFPPTPEPPTPPEAPAPEPA